MPIAFKSTVENFTIPFNPAFFILLNLKSFEILPKQSVCYVISESFTLN